QLAAAGLPDDLKYLAVAESSLLTQAHSPAGAGGYWQFMPKTGDAKGLRRDRLADERYSLEHSTTAALGYLKEHYDTLNSWALAMAAYNCGAQRVQQAIAKQKVADFYRLNFPANINIADLAIAAGTDYKTIRDLNPQFRDYYFPAGAYTIKVPAGLGAKFSEQLVLCRVSQPEPAPDTVGEDGYCTVRPGDTLSHIAERTGVSVKRLQELNGLKKPVIRPGQKLKLKP
ncbi:MAG: LysM peptidoglycan-binding domain-containing protein, partial [Deltaproteobacteria bacterium]